MTTKFSPLTKESSKQDEIVFLNAAADACPEGTYLHDFFTPNLVAWVEEMIRNDFPPDLHQVVLTAHADHDRELAQARKVIEDLNKQLTSVNSTVEALDKAVDCYKAEVTRLNERVTDLLNQARVREDEFDTERYEMRSVAGGLENELEAAHDRITALKVEVYDLTHAAI